MTLRTTRTTRTTRTALTALILGGALALTGCSSIERLTGGDDTGSATSSSLDGGSDTDSGTSGEDASLGSGVDGSFDADASLERIMAGDSDEIYPLLEAAGVPEESIDEFLAALQTDDLDAVLNSYTEIMEYLNE
ncbi:hypothetical protein [Corynebacterium terpenotabidum]|uniref:Uncharacterized protein n=1 Tax=Corynebacterium terpenotabidum Y-11 TaxID=1200352 RepID=S4XEJ6_9CORY|nr:hypothetical protein [Corynebacterium terpenotabidum]AGP30979.1 hypothetical protein A606_06660 [Corynebacterium terpenotabidum Y-11]